MGKNVQDMMGRNHLPSVYGMFNFVMGIGILIIPVITGSLVDYFKTFKAPFLFFAVSQVITRNSQEFSPA